jgi:arylsulfatase A-like enzyme
MRRREFIQTTTGAATGAALAPALARAGDVPVRKPNLLIIHCDELNFRTLGCYRDTLPPEQAFMWGPQAYVETPHIDSIAREGTLCTKFYAATPVCSPSRSSFISGMYPHHTPVTTNNVPLGDDVVSFAHLLGEQGYSTGYAGKWHLDGDGKPQWEPERSFGFQDNRYMFNRGHWKQLELTEQGPRVKTRDRKGQPNYSVEGADDESFTTDWLTDRTLEFIDEHKDTPFCYMLSIPDPHGPDTVREPYDTMYDDSVVEAPRTFGKPTEGVPSWAMPAKNCNYRMASYHGMVKCVDDNVGRIIETLRERDLLDNTILVFTADHGDMRGEHGRQNKGIPLEASAKVPFVIRYPESIPPGARINEVLNTVDFLPSMLSLMGVDTDAADHVQGRDASPLLQTSTAPQDWNDITFMRSTGKPGSQFGWVSALTPRFKLILSSSDDPWLLDLQQDPDELVNFIDSPEHKGVVQQLARELKDYGKRLDDPYTKNPTTSAWIEKLMA